MKILAIIFFAVFLGGCAKDPVSETETDNKSVRLETLFTHDGCTVYRFHDDGRNHYWANCPGVIDSQRAQYCGKGCVVTRDYSMLTTGGVQ